MQVLPGAEPFSSDGSPEAGVLLCHGFTGTPQSMRPWAEHLAGEDFTVRLPLLPGHGTSWQECNRTGWPDWYGAVDGAFTDLRQRCSQVFVAGQSMGGTLALALAEHHGPAVSGLVLVNPSVLTLRKDARLAPLLARLVPAFPAIGSDIAKPGSRELAYDKTPVRAFVSLRRLWRHVRDDLHKVSQPVLLFHSANDHVVEPVSSQVVLDGITSVDVTEVVLPDSYHVATLDYDAPTIFEGSTAFVRRLSKTGAAS